MLSPSPAAEMVAQLETALEELTFVKQALEAAQAEVDSGRAALAAAQAARAAAQKDHAEVLARLAAAEEAAQRGQEAEDALAKQEDKKRRDLENLKKQNERIALIQKAAAEAERVSEEKIGDLKAAMEGLAAKAERLEGDAAGRAQVGGWRAWRCIGPLTSRHLNALSLCLCRCARWVGGAIGKQATGTDSHAPLPFSFPLHSPPLHSPPLHSPPS